MPRVFANFCKLVKFWDPWDVFSSAGLKWTKKSLLLYCWKTRLNCHCSAESANVDHISCFFWRHKCMYWLVWSHNQNTSVIHQFSRMGRSQFPLLKLTKFYLSGPWYHAYIMISILPLVKCCVSEHKKKKNLENHIFCPTVLSLRLSSSTYATPNWVDT